MASWTMFGSDIAGSESDHRAGSTICYSDDGLVVAVGAPYAEVRVFAWNNFEWVQRESTFVGGGRSIALSGDGTVLAYGAPTGDSANTTDSGWVRIYKWNGTTWEDRGKLTGDVAADHFGWSVALSTDGATLAVGAPLRNTNGADGGRVRIYSWHGGTTWKQRGGNLDGTAGSQLGYSIALSGDGNTVVFGAPCLSARAKNGGAIYVYKWTGNAWSYLENNETDFKFLISDFISDHADEKLGYKLVLSKDGSTIVVGCSNSNVHVYKYTYATKFTRCGTLAISEGGARVAVSSDGNVIAVGAPNATVDGNTNAGYAKIYAWAGASTGWVQRGQTITGKAAHQYVGTSVGLSGTGRAFGISDAGHVRMYYYKPAPPTSVKARMQNVGGHLFVEWQHSAGSDSTQITGYRITSSPGNLTQTVGYQDWGVVGGLMNLVSYTFTVVALNEYGISDTSSPSSAVTAVGFMPDAPVNVVARAGINEATLRWTVPEDGGSPIIGYEIITSPASSSTLVDVDDPQPIKITGLAAYVEYTFYITAINNIGASAAGISNPVIILDDEGW